MEPALACCGIGLSASSPAQLMVTIRALQGFQPTPAVVLKTPNDSNIIEAYIILYNYIYTSPWGFLL